VDFLEQYALAGAIGLPIVLVAAANVYLALTGERGTLLLPGPSRFEATPADPGTAAVGAEKATSGGP
jgi:hypothetical protein